MNMCDREMMVAQAIEQTAKSITQSDDKIATALACIDECKTVVALARHRASTARLYLVEAILEKGWTSCLRVDEQRLRDFMSR